MSKLNAFNTTEKSDKGEQTRSHVLQTALRLFRERGFDQTTMRDVAAEAGLSLGAAYYYFDSKEAIVAAYYDYTQAEHLRRARERFAATRDLHQRLSAAVHTKLDLLAPDRGLLSALFRYGGDPQHPLNWFGPQTRNQRELSMQVFAEAIEHEKFPDDIREASPVLLWAMHMGLLLYLLYDESPNQRRTRALADGAIKLAIQGKKLIALSILRPIRKQIFGLLDEAGLLPKMPSARASQA